jgi:hemolysin activation/secretion protein
MNTCMKSVSKGRMMLKPLVAALAMASLQVDAQTQQGVPNSGTILQQVQPALPPALSTKGPTVQVAPVAKGGLSASAPFKVDTIRIVGNTAFSTGTLHALVSAAEGTSMTLPQLEALAARITAYYQRNGFPLSRAAIPVQTVAGASVTIQVLEARYGAVRVNNRSQVSNPLLEATTAALQTGQDIGERGLDRTLLLLSDIPGVGVNAILKPGTDIGTSDLDIITSHNPAAFANLALDNAGNRYIGRTRLSGSVDLVNPLHRGDILTATVVSTGKRMKYGRMSYDTLVNGAGTRAGLAYSAVRYKLGDQVRALDANGTADVASAWIRHPLVRARQANVYVELQYDDKQLRDRIDLSGVRTDRDLTNWVLSLNGDLRDDFLGGGANRWSVSWTAGDVNFQDLTARVADAGSARTEGGYAKWNANFSRIQTVTPGTMFYLNLAGQWSDANLDSAEKLSIGGPYTMRAYDIGALSGDTGYFATVELRHDLGLFAAGRWEATAFIESVRTRINRDAWTRSDNRATLSGAGIGLSWVGPDGWRASLSAATPIGGKSPLVAPQASVRTWFVASKAY